MYAESTRTFFTGWWALILAALTPLYFMLGMVMTTDIFLFLYVSSQRDLLQSVAADFEHCKELQPVPCLTRDGGVVRTLLAMRCEGFRPTEQTLPDTF
ncbi:MAG: hypothetical protein PVI97_06640 [Candidatus Thiodiazotropha sp.]